MFRWIRILCGLVTVAAVWATDVHRAAAEPPSSEQVQAWIEELDSDEFVVRDNATQQLIATGSAAIKPLREAIQDFRSEALSRGVHVLQQMVRSSSLELQDEAFSALEQLAVDPMDAVARRASLALISSADVLSERAIEELTRLGAHMEADPFGMNPAFMRSATIDIGEQWTGSVEDLRLLRRLNAYVAITLTGPQVNDEWMAQLGEVPNLAKLRISRATITEAGLAHLKKLKHLNEVSLTRVTVGDDVLDELQGLQAAQRIDLFGTRISRAGADRLKAQLPNANVDYRGVFLGIKSLAVMNGINWSISAVEPETPAAKAGLQPGDVIRKFDGQDVADFTMLTAMIAARSPGDTVELEVQRGNELVAKTVVFE